MDEPFTGLDPVNVALLKAAFLEMRDRGKTLIFSTHQMDMVEELCDAVAIIDDGRLVASGPTREVKRSTGKQVVRLATDGDPDLPWIADIEGVAVVRPGRDYTELEVVGAGRSRGDPPGGAGARRARHAVRDRRSLDRADLRRAGRQVDARGGVPRRRSRRSRRRPGRRRRGEPVNADVRNTVAVARREFAVRAHTRSFLIGTVLIAVAGVVLALAPIGIQWLEGDAAEKIGVVDQATDPALTFDPVTRLSLQLNASATDGSQDFEVTASPNEAAARKAVEDGDLSAALVIERSPGPDLSFMVVSKDPALRRTPELLRQASYSLAVADRLDRLGVGARRPGRPVRDRPRSRSRSRRHRLPGSSNRPPRRPRPRSSASSWSSSCCWP